jgi:archaellum component FlaC
MGITKKDQISAGQIGKAQEKVSKYAQPYHAAINDLKKLLDNPSPIVIFLFLG